ncbi:hypothetical protein SAMN05421882_101853 [Nitrosomonas communis]|uniref:Uncharacterized protein n=1 Tax=Nitrosomonas communis TaxID=44574 RepID=A0A1H2UY40_9PROT|nr:hypothetical protein SAMN05421882_101853 [Nitrosomonas communis]
MQTAHYRLKAPGCIAIYNLAVGFHALDKFIKFSSFRLLHISLGVDFGSFGIRFTTNFLNTLVSGRCDQLIFIDEFRALLAPVLQVISRVISTFLIKQVGFKSVTLK